jgi:hypothetical protein
VLGSDITQSSFSDGERVTVKSSFSNSKSDELEQVAMSTPSSGKVTPIKGAPDTTTADIKATDSAADSTDQVVSQASVAVGDGVTTDNMTVDTTTTSDSNSTSPNGQENGPIITQSSTPEPSSMILVGSIFLGLGLIKRRRGKRL